MSKFNSILLTTDLSAYAETAIPYAAELARKFGGILKLVHVFDSECAVAAGPTDETTVPIDWQAVNRIERKARLAELAEKIQKNEHIEVVPCIREGTPVNEIVDEAAKSHADCIVVATHARSGIAHFLFGSIAEKLVRASPCPVMTVMPEKRTP
jgi:nucleotide-binding universal stress UspA family protein